MALQLAGAVSNIIPVHIPVYEDVRYVDGEMMDIRLTISPISLFFGVMAQGMYIANTVHAYRFIRTQARYARFALPDVRFIPSVTATGTPGASLVYRF